MAGLVGKMLDHYHLREQIGKGGMATVYRAVETNQLKEVAVKVLSPMIGGERKFLKRFRREAELVKQYLRHPNIVPVIDYGESRGYVYLVMPFIEGLTLHDRLVENDLTDEERVRWVDQISAALLFAHSKGIIHRDIKPSNVLIDKEGDALLTDFGLAREVDGSNTLTGSMLMGTPAYVSPEQGRGEKLDARSDQYSLGVIIYQMTTGHLPFEEMAPMATVLAHIQEPVPPPRRINPQIPPDVERVILKGLAKHREDRFVDVEALNEAYQSAMAGLPVPAHTMAIDVAPMVESGHEISKRLRDVKLERRDRQRRPAWFGLMMALTLVSVGVIAVVSVSETGWAGKSTGNPVPNPTLTAAAVVTASVSSPTATIEKPPAPPVTSDACPGVRLHPPEIDGNMVKWLVDNAAESGVRLQHIRLDAWPAGNGAPERIRLGSETVWEGEYTPGMLFEFAEGSSLVWPAGGAAMLEVKFHWGAAQQGYKLSLDLDAGCTLSGQW